jgi:hypothetical protein
MGARHVEDLFSAAYDDTLDERERRRFDEHLADCPRCTAAADEFRQAIDAVRAMPPARMPVRVVLPATPPEVERRRRRLWLPAPAWGAAAMAAAVATVVVVVAHGHGGSGARSTTALTVPNAVPGLQAAGGAGASRQGAGPAGCPTPLLTTSAAFAGSALSVTGGSPAGFANRVSVTNPQRPGEELVLATTSGRYAAGSQVLVFAVLTSSSGSGSTVVPCVTLHALSQAQAAAGAQSGAGGAEVGAAPVPLDIVDRPLAIAVPTQQTVDESLPVQVLTIPAGLKAGTVLHLVALIPAGVPQGSDRPAIEAVLTVEVS